MNKKQSALYVFFPPFIPNHYLTDSIKPIPAVLTFLQTCYQMQTFIADLSTMQAHHFPSNISGRWVLTCEVQITTTNRVHQATFMPHYVASTRGGATCSTFKVAASFSACLTPKQQIVGPLHADLHTPLLFISFSVFHPGPDRSLSSLPELLTGVQGGSQLQPQLDEWKDGERDGRREGKGDYLMLSAKTPFSLSLGIKTGDYTVTWMITQQLSSGFAAPSSHLQIKKIKSFCTH